MQLEYQGETLDEIDFFTAPFSLDRQHMCVCALLSMKLQHHNRFLIEDEATFFTNAQRSRMVFDILKRTPWDPDETDKEYKTHLGIDRLLDNEPYASAFPLHEVRSFRLLSFAIIGRKVHAMEHDYQWLFQRLLCICASPSVSKQCGEWISFF